MTTAMSADRELNVIESVTLCQQHVDTKDFKGKGRVIAWARDAGRRLDAVRQDMAALASATDQVAPRYFHLQLHSRTATGGLSLRWRLVTGPHALWEDLAPWIAELPRRISGWYDAANAEAELLNAMEQAVRAEVRTARRLAARLGDVGPWQGSVSGGHRGRDDYDDK